VVSRPQALQSDKMGNNGMITVGLAAHRVEAIPFLKNLIADHEVIILEEPPHLLFQAMLKGKVPIPAYLEQIDPSFPIYSERIYHLLQACYRQGKLVTQIEPYLTKLNGIHESIEKGSKPTDLTHQPDTKAVYDAENMTFAETTRGVRETHRIPRLRCRTLRLICLNIICH